MPTILQLRRGTTAENDAYTGSVGELTVDTDLNKLRLHDGSTAGGDTIGDGSGNIQIGVTGNNEIDTSSGNLTIDSSGGTVTVDDNLIVSGNLTVSGTTTTVDSTTIEVQNQLVFEGSTSDDYELTLTAGDPTADRTITLPDTTDTLVGKATIDTLTNKTLTSAVLNTAVSGTAILDEDNMASDSATQLATQQSIKAYVDAQVTASDLDFQGDSGGALSIDLDSETFTVAGGTGISTSGSSNTLTVKLDDTAVSAGSYGSSTAIPTFTVDAQGRLTAASTTAISSDMSIAGDSGTDTITVGTDTFTIAGGTGLSSTATTDTITLNIDSTVATLTGTQTLTNKTIDTASNTITIVEADISDLQSYITASSSDTLTNKTIALGSNTVSGTTAQFNSALSDGSFATLAGTETLTNKTLTSPVIATISNTGTLTLPTSSDTLVGRDTTDEFTGKTIDSAYNTLTLDLGEGTLNGTISEFNSALSDGSFATLAGSETLTNKTLTSPVISAIEGGTGSITLNPDSSSDLVLSSDSIKYGDADSTQTVIDNAGTGALYIQNSTSNITVYNGGNIEINPNSGNTVTIAGDTTVSTNLTVSGNLTVNGTTTTVASTNTTIADNLIELNSGAASNANDTGILIERGSTGDNAIMAWDESADKFIFGTTTATNTSTGDLTITSGTIVASTFEGALTGNVTGDVTGDVTGNITGNVTGDVTGNADTATTLETARTIAGQSFDGSANISIASTDLSDTADITYLTATQTLTNKTIAAGSNTISGLTSSHFASAVTLVINDSSGSAVKTIVGSAS